MGLRGFHRSLHSMVGRQVGIDVLELAIRGGGDCPGLLEQVQRCRALGRGRIHFVRELRRPDRLVVLLEGPRHLTESFLGCLAGGEERLQAQVLRAVEQRDLGGLAVAAGPADLLVVGVQ
jgi:hypothetical protein